MNESTPQSVLLLAEADMAKELAGHMDPQRVLCVDDAYDVLLELVHRSCAAVVVTTDQTEMENFARAIRRLNQSVKLLAVCQPGDAAQARAEAERIADGTCSYPPTRGELNYLLRGVPDAEETRPPVALDSGQIAGLIQATQTRDALEAEVARIVSAAAPAPVRWVSAEECGGVEPLLRLSNAPTRLLVSETPFPRDENLDALITDLHQLLPSLDATAGRTESLHRLAITDHLTGAYNRRYFYHLADHILRRAAEKNFRATLLLYDIDDFKRYNDQYGHAAGDEILRDTAMLMRGISREQDIVARLGGDEFAVLFWDFRLRDPDSEPLRDVWDLADRFRKAVENHHLPSLGPEAKGELTISGGLASFPEHGGCCLDLLRQADRALRVAKDAGKNSIHLVGKM